MKNASEDYSGFLGLSSIENLKNPEESREESSPKNVARDGIPGIPAVISKFSYADGAVREPIEL